MAQTGPRTPEGKAIVSANAVKHGLRSTRVVIPGLEIQADWDQFFHDAIEAQRPVGAIEYALAERIATLIWRLRRAARAERDSAIVAGMLVEGSEEDLPTRIAALIRGFGEQLFPGTPELVDPPGFKGPQSPVRLPSYPCRPCCRTCPRMSTG
jgi:hypothetical protein